MDQYGDFNNVEVEALMHVDDEEVWGREGVFKFKEEYWVLAC